MVRGNIVIVGTLTRCKLLHFTSDLKATLMNVHCYLIWKLLLYEFKLVHKATEVNKNICCEKGERTVDLSTVTGWLKKFRLGEIR